MRREDDPVLSALLDRVGWSTTELAERLEINPNTVRQWMRQRRRPPAPVLSWLAQVGHLIALAGKPAGWEEWRKGRQAP